MNFSRVNRTKHPRQSRVSNGNSTSVENFDSEGFELKDYPPPVETPEVLYDGARNKHRARENKKRNQKRFINSELSRMSESVQPPNLFVSAANEVTVWVVDRRVLQAGTRSKDLVWTENDFGAHMNGSFLFEGKPLRKVGFFRYLSPEDIIRKVSDCGLLVSVVHSIPTQVYPDYTSSDEMFVGGPLERVRMAAHTVVRRAVNSKYMYDDTNLARNVENEYRRFHMAYPSLKSDVTKVINEDWFLDEVKKYYDRRHELWADITETRLGSYYAERGGAYKRVGLVAKTLFLVKYGSIFLLPPLTLAYVLRKAPKSISNYKVMTTALLGLTATSMYHTWNVCKDVWLYGIRNTIIRGTLSETKLDNQLPMTFTPCSKMFFKKNTFNKELRDLPNLWEKVNMIVEETLHKPDQIEIYGSTTEAPAVYPTSSNANLEAAFRIRCGFDRTIDEAYSEEFKEYGRRFIEALPRFDIGPISDEECLSWLKSQYGEKRGARIFEERDELLDTSDVNCEAFVKAEVYLGKTEENFKPRMIWKRSDKMLAKFGVYFNRLSQKLSDFFNLNNNFYYATKCTPEDVGKFAQKIFDENPYQYEADVSNWDGSITSHMLWLELQFLKTKVDMISTNAVDENWLYKHWKIMGAHSKDGKVVYKANHGRRSGDLWTSTFNTLLNFIITGFVNEISIVELREIMCMALGDDNVVGLQRPYSRSDLTSKYAKLGMSVEILERSSVYETTFCSGLFWNVGGFAVWGNLPFRSWSKFGWNHHKHNSKIYKRLLYGMCKGMLCTAGHVPIFGTFLRAVANSAKKSGIKAYVDNRDLNPYRIQGGRVLEPTFETILQFAERYGLAEADILIMDKVMSTFDINDFPGIFSGPMCLVGIETDLNIEMGPRQELLLSEYKEIVYDTPRLEEREKLEGATNFPQAIHNAARFGLEEMQLGAGMSHIGLHCLFTAVSYFCFEAGVRLHSKYNAFALQMCATQNLKMSIVPCAKKKLKNKKKNKKKNNGGNGSQNNSSLQGAMTKAVASGLRAAGMGIGSWLGGPAGGKMGYDLGAGVSRITGFGDYTIKENTVLKGDVPTFSTGSRFVTLRHQEYLGDVSSSVSFTNTTFNIQPGDPTTFPWLSQIATRFQQYKFRGLVFIFKSTSATALNSTNTALGTVIMGTNYNVNDPVFVNKIQAENYEFSNSRVPSESFPHGVECSLEEQPYNIFYVRDSAVPSGQDPKLYDLGLFQLCTVGSQAAAVIGELWVSYHIELYKPRLTNDVYQGAVSYLYNSAYTDANPLGTGIQTTVYADIPITVSGTVITLENSISGGFFELTIRWLGTGAACTLAAPTLANLTGVTLYGSSSSFFYGPQTGATASTISLNYCFKVNGFSSSGSTVTFAGMTLPTAGSSVSITLVALDDPTTL